MHSREPGLTRTRSVTKSGGGDGTSAGVSRFFVTNGRATKTANATRPRAYTAIAVTTVLRIEALQQEAQRDHLHPDADGEHQARVRGREQFRECLGDQRE